VFSIGLDLRSALRTLRQRPLFALVAIASVAIGIGATTTIFSVANALLLKPPAGIDDPARVVEVSRTMGGRGRDTFSYPEMLDLRAQASDAFEYLAGWNLAPLSYSTGGDGERIIGFAVSWNYFRVMGVTPLRGRFFTAEEDQVPMASPVAVVSEAFWRERLGADPDVVGRTITLDRHSFTVIGVVPASFRGHIFGVRPAVYLPMMMMGAVRPGFNEFTERRASWFVIVGRLKPGVSVATADAAAKTVFARMPQTSDDPRNARSATVELIGLVPAAGRPVTRAFLGMMLGLVFVILLVTCANVAGMLLARGAARSREIAIRLALGSGRGRLVRQLLTESLVLFALGGGAGLLITFWGTGLLASVPLPTPVPLALDFSPDLRVVAAGLALALATGLVFGLAPALQATRHDLAEAMKASGVETGRSGRLRRAFVMGQVGLSMILLLSAGLFLRALQKAANVSTGFDAHNVSTVSFDLSIDGYDEARGQVFLRDLLDRLRAAPGVAAAAAANDLPLDLNITESPAYVPGAPVADAEGWVQSAFYVATPGYFETMRIPVVQGRDFDARDGAGSQPTVVVSRTFAERVWPGRNPIGQTLRWGEKDGPVRTVIGVVGDVKNQSLMETAEPTMYLPATQVYQPRLTVVVRGASGADPSAILRRVVHEADPALSLSTIVPMETVAAAGILPQRLAALITSVLGALALLLSALGVYGVVAFMVAQRTREIGVRMALGARANDVVRLVLRSGLRLALPGLLFGLVAGLALSWLLRSFILDVTPGDPVTFLGVPAVLTAAVALACWAPARRAAAVEPSTALRAE